MCFFSGALRPILMGLMRIETPAAARARAHPAVRPARTPGWPCSLSCFNVMFTARLEGSGTSYFVQRRTLAGWDLPKQPDLIKSPNDVEQAWRVLTLANQSPSPLFIAVAALSDPWILWVPNCGSAPPRDLPASPAHLQS